MGIITKIGDLFTIPLGDISFGLGIVVNNWNGELYLVLFKEQFDNLDSACKAQINELTPIFASSSLDAKLWHGQWKIIRNNIDVSMIMQPIYKVEEPQGTLAESFDRKFRKVINPIDAERLDYRATVAPIRLENALLAYHGIGEWNPIFEKLYFANVIESNKIIKQ